MKYETIRTDITVVGGGLSGVSAAVAAARLGRTVALVQNRPVLGGNSSSEVRVWVCGATAHGTNRYARETGIMGELLVENQFRNPDGNPYYWDLVVLEAVLAEPNIQLFLNTDVHEVEAEGDAEDRRIRSVTGWMMGSERRIRFESAIFADCTGDGLVGFLAGAKYRVGREAKHEYNEDWAPDTADGITLGSTLLFYTKDAGHPVKYVPPGFAKDITQTSIPIKRVIRSGDSGCHYWWIEWGGELDTVHENERIRDELWAVIYGIWEYIKNSGKFDAEHMTLEWVGSLPGKREYRRFIGDYVLNQNDILAQREFEDRVAFGGWSIDLHPPQGMYSAESGSKHLHADGIYHIPFRSLYSANVSNLMFAGRNISASHVAFGTTRVMATCAVIGEAAGTGAALAVQHGATPRAVYREHLAELQQTLLRQDASVIGLRSADVRDLARRAKVTASGTLRLLAVEQASGVIPLDRDAGLLVPVSPRLERIELLVDASAEAKLEVEVWSTGRAENYVPHRREASGSAAVAPGERQWISVPLRWEPGTPQHAFVIVKASDLLSLHFSSEPQTGVLCFAKNDRPLVSTNLEDHQPEQPVVQWSMRQHVRKPYCFRLFPETEAFSPDRVTDGYLRPYGQPHLWISQPLGQGQPASLELQWQEAMTMNEIHLVFNDDVNEDLINLHHHKTPFDVIPELVRDYRLEALQDGGWVTLHEERANRKRKRVHRIASPVTADRLRLVVESTNGSSRAEVVEIRVYDTEA
ncbi:putative FAD-binding dehydrogenase [Paenibacillus konkukensis]|uniref:FAD-binding dehydrogenase n=1 Tax=Paenibacillus konkukensis TaxID=2020716 RepID=A0ABY4RU48_9BACL|nr:FAD-dependent oxidoreductase [Paenibacillus konkukensis]UQZ85166.1 putative FAD-binding dehydrogenase [Paenibacillus konkukensis]